MIFFHERINLSLDSRTQGQIKTLAGLTEDTFDDDHGDRVLANDILGKTVNSMRPSNILRTHSYIVGEHILEVHRLWRRRLAALTISERDERKEGQPKPHIKIIFNRNTHAIKSIDRIVPFDSMGESQNVSKRMWPPLRRR